ncbi:hypothetical protein HS088_TW14G00171 [Tripterygium wilfordii]|uniref:Late embryogenesis abundant protein n=1 Tax=Tripterygium wilfordii TaxID=458696 RepID=A0A7J7CPV8_TRIWF|nr:uncharacterized protein LOC120015678 [Tripterygium wilfordii]KAF5736038.1 hypothetical protein HS088_TW14G00171 [Tripterygium wilfordii]
MNYAIRSIRTTPPAVFPYHFGRKSCAVKLRRVTTLSAAPDSEHSMDKTNDPTDKTGDVMSHSFGEGYATRSDEEGFGGIYVGNQSSSKADLDKEIHENHPAYDKTQGSEVKEKEKARHQKHEST